MSAQAYRLIWW